MASSQPTVTIALDCDELLCSFIDGVNRYHNRVYGTSIQLSDYHSTHFASVLGWGGDLETNKKVHEFFQGSPEWLGLSPLSGAFSTLESLKAQHPFLDFVVVTARSHHQKDDTLKWLSLHFPGLFSNVVFLSAYDNPNATDSPAKTKGEACRELGALMLVDDSPKYCITAAADVPLVVLFSRVPWNTGREEWEAPALPANVLRVANWEGLGKVLHRVGTLCGLAGVRGGATPPSAPLAFSHCGAGGGGGGGWGALTKCLPGEGELPAEVIKALGCLCEKCII